jgi:hypothetical protein
MIILCWFLGWKVVPSSRFLKEQKERMTRERHKRINQEKRKENKIQDRLLAQAYKELEEEEEETKDIRS